MGCAPSVCWVFITMSPMFSLERINSIIARCSSLYRVMCIAWLISPQNSNVVLIFDTLRLLYAGWVAPALKGLHADNVPASRVGLALVHNRGDNVRACVHEHIVVLAVSVVGDGARVRASVDDDCPESVVGDGAENGGDVVLHIENSEFVTVVQHCVFNRVQHDIQFGCHFLFLLPLGCCSFQTVNCHIFIYCI